MTAARPPNPRLQRTRMRAPLSRKPFGDEGLMNAVTKWLLVLSMPFVLGSSSCGHAQRDLAVSSDQRTSEERIRELATQHRDQWLAKHVSEDSAQLARGVIESVEKVESGWHVLFATHTGGGPGAEEGLHVYFLHLYLTSSGELVRVIRGPDLLS